MTTWQSSGFSAACQTVGEVDDHGLGMRYFMWRMLLRCLLGLV